MPLTYFQPSQVDSTFNGYLRNRIINGAMMIDQRNAGAAFTNAGYNYTLDRWVSTNSQNSKYTVQQNGGGVTPPAGFTNYLGVTSTSAYSVGASDYFGIAQPIEGLNVPDLAWGTASAKSVTVSFWVRSSLTGSFGGSIYNSAANRSYPFSYTISGANTWTYVAFTVPGDTTGTWLTTNGVGLTLLFTLGAGSTYSGPANAWAGSFYLAPTGSTSVVGTNGATWLLTGVQLEVGAVATPFERRMYGQELALCQRYFVQWTGSSAANGFAGIATGLINSSTAVIGLIPLPVSMRTTPTLSYSGTISVADGAVTATVSSLGIQYITAASNMWAVFNTGGTQTSGKGAFIYTQNAATNYFIANSEL